MKRGAIKRDEAGDSDDGLDDGPKGRFQQTVRCSLGEVCEAAKLLKEPHRLKVREAGFGCVFDWVLEGNVSRVLMCYLLMNIDTKTMKIDCGFGRVLTVNRDSVHHIFGFPCGGETAPRPSDSGHDAALASLKAELGFDRKANIDTKDLRSLLVKLVEDDTKIDSAVKVFFSILYNKLICPGSAVRLGREVAMLLNMDYKKMARMDFCQLVVDELKRAAEKYQKTNIPQAGPEGCGVVPVIMYLDSCHSKAYSVMHRLTPRANYLHEKPLRSIFALDRIRKGKSDLSKYVFGRLPWKGRNDIACSYKLSVEELQIECSPEKELEDEPVPLNTSRHEIDCSQHPHAAGPSSSREAAAGFSNATPTNVIAEIDLLLLKVEEMSRSIPTSEVRLSRISGLFPDGHGPEPDAVKRNTYFEASVIDSLSSALAYVRKGFVDLGAKQDLFRAGYEREAETIEKQIQSEFPDVEQGLGQNAEDAEDAVWTSLAQQSELPLSPVCNRTCYFFAAICCWRWDLQEPAPLFVVYPFEELVVLAHALQAHPWFHGVALDKLYGNGSII